MLKKPGQRGDNEISQKHNGQYRQTEKPEEPAGLLLRVGFLTKKVHEPQSICNTRLAKGK
jgi:hypothetical protein